jgi:hypothetical protein
VWCQTLRTSLRPEVAESLFVLHEVTGNPIYREWGWSLFQALETRCKTVYGYAGYDDVTRDASPLVDRQETHVLAETLKYLYLLFQPNHGYSLTEYVFNTNGHPTKIFNRG